jgi:hypothetical protein
LASSLVMARRITAWLLVLPLALVGTQLAHETAYRIAAPGTSERARLLADTGHAYLAYAPIALGFGVALVLSALLLSLLGALRGSAVTHASPWALAVLAPLGFTLQEHAERLLHDGTFPWSTAIQPAFLLGLALQLPFTLAAYLFARGLLAAADRLGRALAGLPSPRARPFPAAPVRPGSVDLVRLPALALGHAGRGPPRR